MSMQIAYLMKILDTIKQSTSDILTPAKGSNMNSSHTTYASVGIGGALAIVLPWLLQAMFHVPVPADVAVALGTLSSGVSGYFFHKLNPQLTP